MFQRLEKELRCYLSNRQIKKIYHAFQFAEKAHAHQVRYSGEPYILHPLETARILAKMRLDVETIIAALLHDTLEDTFVDKLILKKRFGNNITDLVDGVTKLPKIGFENRTEAQAENFRKMILAMTRDIRVILIKLADRLHNLRTLEGHSSLEKRKRIVRETLDVYAPITHRLGMYDFLKEFGELGFKILYPKRYKILKQSVKKILGDHKELVQLVEDNLKHLLHKSKLSYAMLFGREKDLYSLYCKMRYKHLRFSEIMDLHAFRIVLKDVGSCYRALGLVHNLYKPISDRFKDFIAVPKINGYQSLHTTVLGPHGTPIEIQIRTVEMDQVAEKGIAAHWLYKSEHKKRKNNLPQTKKWIEELLQLQQTSLNSIEFFEEMKMDLSFKELTVFTPKGESIKLPVGSTLLDFAYATHSEIGHCAIAGKINSALTSLYKTLKNGDTVEILTGPIQKPDPRWLDVVITGRARSTIRHFLKQKTVSDRIMLGAEIFIDLLKNLDDADLGEINNQTLTSIAQRLNITDLNQLCDQIGSGQKSVASLLLELSKKIDRKISHSIINNPLIKPKPIQGGQYDFASCCYPIPGDAMVKIPVGERHWMVHRKNCNMIHFLTEKTQAFPYFYLSKTSPKEFHTRLAIMTRLSGAANLTTLLKIILCSGVEVTDITREKSSLNFQIDYFVIKVASRLQLSRLIRALRHAHSVMKISRHLPM